MNRVEKMIRERNRLICDLLNESPESIAQKKGRALPAYESIAVNCSFACYSEYPSKESIVNPIEEN